MEVAYTQKAMEDISFWKNTGNKKVMTKISALVENIKLKPFEGLGKPEPLKHSLNGTWSRRINLEHRLVYEVNELHISILSAKGHYN
jgi:toxin YoeB